MQELTVTEYKNIRVLTTQQIATAYGTEDKRISENFNANKSRYVEGKHYIRLDGGELKNFLQSANSVVQNPSKVRALYLWTEKGAFLHAKSLNTDVAWEVYDKLVDNYFDCQENGSISQKQEKPKKKNLSAANMLIKNVTDIFTKAGVNPLFIATEAKRLYKEQADVEIKIPLVTDKEDMPKLYDCTEIAKELGILSTNGKLHNQAVSAILSKLNIEESEIVKTAFSRNGHDDVTTQYKPSVYTKVENWLEENSYPSKIPYTDSKGNYKTYSVVYQEVA